MTDHATRARAQDLYEELCVVVGCGRAPELTKAQAIDAIAAALEQAAHEVLNHPDYQACCERRQELYDQLQYQAWPPPHKETRDE